MTKKEEKIIKQCQQGDLEKFGDLYKAYFDKIYRFIYYKTHHKETTEDIVSQTFFKALDKIKNFDFKKGNFSSWLYLIARNLVIDYYRTEKASIDIYDIWDLTDDEDIERDAEIKEQLQKVRAYLKGLKGEYREIILMRVWGGLSYKKIAEIVGKSEPNCRMIFSRVINQLRKEEIFALLLLITLIKPI